MRNFGFLNLLQVFLILFSTYTNHYNFGNNIIDFETIYEALIYIKVLIHLKKHVER